VTAVHLTFRLAPNATRVLARLELQPNPARGQGHDLRLDGEGLRLIGARLNGAALNVTPDDTGLIIAAHLLPQGDFTLETEVEIAPEGNFSLEGLYMSNGMYCTQCEAQGFRHITFYPDRPDVMAPFTVRIESDLPVLLSNGNPVAQGAGWAEWHDPWPKPAYLFALVAGDLLALSDSFTTMGGRKVDLNIYVRPGDEDRANNFKTCPALVASPFEVVRAGLEAVARDRARVIPNPLLAATVAIGLAIPFFIVRRILAARASNH